jgi:hypothetical protein
MPREVPSMRLGKTAAKKKRKRNKSEKMEKTPLGRLMPQRTTEQKRTATTNRRVRRIRSIKTFPLMQNRARSFETRRPRYIKAPISILGRTQSTRPNRKNKKIKIILFFFFFSNSPPHFAPQQNKKIFFFFFSVAACHGEGRGR